MTARRFSLASAMFGALPLVAATLVPSAALAEEGMWTFDNFPVAAVKARYGVDIDQAWLDHVQHSAVRLASGCSASLVSKDGLVLTNNHCVAECNQNLSTPGHDLFTFGYAAEERKQEKVCPGQQAEILTAITDVTARLVETGRGAVGEALIRAREAEIAAIEKQGCPDTKATRCQVIDLYHGGQYKLYRFRIYSDVRLVFSPGVIAGFFGGDPDNFHFPRYDLDAAFLRLYENGKAVDTPEHLAWNKAAPRAGEAVFIAGDPRFTDRQLTISQLETQRDLILPISLLLDAELRGRLIRFGEESADHQAMVHQDLFRLENTYKMQYGRLFSLSDKSFMAALVAKEDALRLRAGNDAPWQAIATAQNSARNLYLRNLLLAGPMKTSSAGGGSKLFAYATTLVRAAEERAKPSDERLAGFDDAQLPLIEHRLLAPQPVDKPLEQLHVEYWLTKVRELLTVDDPTTNLILGKDNPEALATRLVVGSRLEDPAVRRALWTGGLAAIRASDDPLIRFLLRIDPAARTVSAEMADQVDGPSLVAAERIAHARFVAYGDRLYPDATLTPRLAYGQIVGWKENGRDIAPFTQLGGLYDRATGEAPFVLDPRWVAAKDKLDLATVFDISFDADAISGNSGSPIINAKGEVIGALFDGNIHSLGSDYGYDTVLDRQVGVSAAAISAALTTVYHLPVLAAELERR